MLKNDFPEEFEDYSEDFLKAFEILYDALMNLPHSVFSFMVLKHACQYIARQGGFTFEAYEFGFLHGCKETWRHRAGIVSQG